MTLNTFDFVIDPTSISGAYQLCYISSYLRNKSDCKCIACLGILTLSLAYASIIAYFICQIGDKSNELVGVLFDSCGNKCSVYWADCRIHRHRIRGQCLLSIKKNKSKKTTQIHDLYYSLCYNILVGLQISNDKYSGPPWYPFINPLSRGPQGFIVACKYACS